MFSIPNKIWRRQRPEEQREKEEYENLFCNVLQVGEKKRKCGILNVSPLENNGTMKRKARKWIEFLAKTKLNFWKSMWDIQTVFGRVILDVNLKSENWNLNKD